ncbi:hypothetical protein VE03_02789 [Pseudogymnoascus sp. 23342-1-I1]|nr:hypothetical protein VE03_02789 [Pseudogymnoascus sp. 23342-1-I1]
MKIVHAAAFLTSIVLGFAIVAVAHYLRIWRQRARKDELGEEEQPLLRAVAQELDPLKLEIRLMCLHGGPVGSALECSLQVQSLGSDADYPCYEALSYVWAAIPGKAMLYVDDVQHEISANLAQALSHLRYEDRDRLLWVDAVCINQNHTVERGHQVRLMGTVYSRASVVLIWLGPETHDSAQALQDLETLSQDKHFKELDVYGKMDDDGQTWIPAPAERIDALENLLKRAYWSRIWVVQEIVRAKKATVFCGALSIAWETCVKARDNWPKHSRNCCNTECSLIDPRIRRVMNWLNSSWRLYRETNGDLLSQLNLTRSLKATDPRDKIFGALGLVHDETSFLDPDYKSEYPVVFRDWTAKLINTTQCLDVLLYTNISLRHPDIPSWVPDWTQYNPSIRFQAERLQHHQHISRSFRADSCLGVRSAISTIGNLLRLPGFHLDVVAKVGERLVYDRQDSLTDDQNQIGAIKKWDAVLESWAQVADLTSSADSHYPGSGKYSDAYWRTLVSDHITELGTFLGDRISADDTIRYKLWHQWFADLVKQPDEKKTAYYKDCLAANRDLDRFDWTIMNMNYNRRLFSTKNGRIGMGPADMEPNDLVTILSGGRTPFIVRPSDLESANKGGNYQIIGYAYVHGVMDGEIRPLNEQWEDVWIC